MNKKFTVVIVAVVILVVTWVTMGSEGKEVPYVTITELKDSNHAKPGIRYILGGIVKEGTIQKQEEKRNLLNGGEQCFLKVKKITKKNNLFLSYI